MQESVENELLAEIRRLKKRIDAQDALIAELRAAVAAKDKRIAELEGKVAQLSKNSSTSSKSPSSDLGKGTRNSTRARGKRKPGGQPGHPKHERMPFTPDQVEVHPHKLDACPDCGGPVELTEDGPRVVARSQIICSYPAASVSRYLTPPTPLFGRRDATLATGRWR
jgi:uncharacterized coiled-coil protein SlyX